MKNRYIHTQIPELSGQTPDLGPVRVGSSDGGLSSGEMETALGAMRLARRLGIKPDEPLLFEAPLLSAVVNKRLLHLRSWSVFDSCIKGFNVLGLMAEQVRIELDRIRSLPLPAQNDLKAEFIRSRMDAGGSVFSADELCGLGPSEWFEVDDLDLALWICFAKRTIVCSTSSNMGIATHQALRLMQKSRLSFRGREFGILNANEGSLIIWCPDERADFMNQEKTQFLKALERDLPRITSLKTYINRQQRDPGALKDALLRGGYFFPTNPQSPEEMQNLVLAALGEIAKEQARPIAQIVSDPNIRWGLERCGCQVSAEGVLIRRGIESGIHGLMIPYFVMVEQFLAREMGRAVSVWNQASIGAALAGAVLADKRLRDHGRWSDTVRSDFNDLFPNISRFLDTRKPGKDLKTRIHGVFDIANLQSLAQRVGVVVEDHLSGRGTAYVGLGSSSYSNGNRCVDILRESMSDAGAFQGKSALHPATHSLNAFAQALIFGEDLYRSLERTATDTDGPDPAECSRLVKKPEPAGAAALAGYLLSRLDRQTLSIVELAYGLKLVGFSRRSFLEFADHEPNEQGARMFLQTAFEEGPLMERLAQDLLALLDWDLEALQGKMTAEKNLSRERYWQAPLDDLEIEYLSGATCIYLTGDNTRQVRPELMAELASACLANASRIESFLADAKAHLPAAERSAPADQAYLFFYRAAKKAASIGARMETMGRRWAHERLSKSGSAPRD